MVIIHGNVSLRSIIVIEHVRDNVQTPKTFFCCIFQNHMTYDDA
jgi:hypothetical protein